MPSSDEALTTFDPTQLILTVCSLISLVLTVASCLCCRKIKLRDHGDAQDVNNASTSAAVYSDGTIPYRVECRPTLRVEKVTERRSQPNMECDRMASDGALIRNSVPLQTGRALPKLPLDMYSVICKTRKANVGFVDEDGNPTYESIDPENDSLIDPLYSKLGEVSSSRPERKYDYPVFSGRKTAALAVPDDGFVYQNASQIYTICGSEDPYSSITSEPPRSNGAADQEGCSSSNYNARYAKDGQEDLNAAWRRERLERTEMEVDQLYSKIRRSSLLNSDDTASVAEPSQVAVEDKMGDIAVPAVSPHSIKNVDAESLSSREPSYRYITVRENADLVRERLRLQGQLAPPVREHYYSVIGNEYETVGDVPSTSTYSAVDIPPAHDMLNVTTTFSEFAPPPPTSPIPDRTACEVDVQQPCSSRTHDAVTPLYSVVSKPRIGSTDKGVLNNSGANGFHPVERGPTSTSRLESGMNASTSFPSEHEGASSSIRAMAFQERLA
ncbi:unnamed protein product [Cylicocyclus nassatus]|uniref:Uncharacterized protein n=1 Tax=Cylicocyclus nassatus TaxID=53992 RepID=A0AA36HF84_CYLNA|nr:unnamed protein product [Cylicocyclus nassatus]